MAVPTRSGAAQAKQLRFFNPWVPHEGASAAVDRCGENPALEFLFNQTELRYEAMRLLSAGRVRLVDVAGVVLGEIESEYAGNAATAKKVGGVARRFFRFAEAADLTYTDEITSEFVQRFVMLPSRREGRPQEVSFTTASNRQSHVRAFFRAMTRLGFWAGSDPVGVSIRRIEAPPPRLLSEAEVRAVRAHADAGLFTTGRAVLVALAEAGGDAPEIAQVTADHLDLVRGTVTFSGVASRVNPLSEWGLVSLGWLVTAGRLSGAGRLCVRDDLEISRAAQSITVRLRTVLLDAGLSRSGATPKSIRLTAARAVLERAGIEAAARFLGNESLDATAQALNHRWGDA